ncbi:MAG: hypothetical protein AB7S38_37060 [Vulcanimicrobiota bacterium]
MVIRPAFGHPVPRRAGARAPVTPEAVDFAEIRSRAISRRKTQKLVAAAAGLVAGAAALIAPPEYRVVLGLGALCGVGYSVLDYLDPKPQAPVFGQRADLAGAYLEARQPDTTPARRQALFAELQANLETGPAKTSSAVSKSMNEVSLVTLENGATALDKPSAGANPKQVRKNILPARAHHREQAAYVVDRWLGHLVGVPPSVPTPDGLRTLYIPDGQPALNDPATGWIVSHPERSDYRNLAIFDNVIGNLDRHRRNYLVLEQGQLVPIDHDLAFPTANQQQDGGHFEFSEEFALNRHERDQLEHLLTSRAQVSQELEPLLPTEAIEAMFERITTMLELGRTYSHWRN